MRSCRRALEDNVARLKCGKHVVGNSLAVCNSVLKGKPLNVDKLYLARLNLVGKKRTKNVARRLRDGRADAVAAANAYLQNVKAVVINEVALRLHILNAKELLLEDFLKLFKR